MWRFTAVFFLLMFVIMLIGPKVGEARLCLSPSNRFKGVCVSSTNCASVCYSEGFSGGECRGFRRRCFCTKPC